MNHKKPPETDDEILDAFAELLDQVRPETTEEIQEILLDAGLDPGKLAVEARSLVQESLANSPHNWRNAQGALEKAKEELDNATQAVPSTKSGLLAAINLLLSQSTSKLVGAHFRNESFDEMSYEELKSLFEELSYLNDQD